MDNKGPKLKRNMNLKKLQMEEGTSDNISTHCRPPHCPVRAKRLTLSFAICDDRTDRCITIDRENKKLLQRMQEVVTHQQMDCWLKPKKAQSNWLHRKHEQMRIVADNKVRKGVACHCAVCVCWQDDWTHCCVPQ